MSSSTYAATSRGEKPLLVLTDPGWSFERSKCDIEKFFEEAQVPDDGIEILQARFDKFSSFHEGCKGEAAMSFAEFRRMNTYYGLCKHHEEEHFYRAMNHNRDKLLSFQDFLLGCVASSPKTPHILNSITGFVRARFAFDYYNVSRSGSLDFEELARLLDDTRRPHREPKEVRLAVVTEYAQKLGDVSLVTLRVNSPSGWLCDFRASTRWTGLQVRRQIARQLKLPVQGQDLFLGERPFPEQKVMETLIPFGATSADLMLAHAQWDLLCTPEPSIMDGVVGLECLVHVTFEKLYGSLIGEEFRGTSRLFRSHRPLLAAKRSALGGA